MTRRQPPARILRSVPPYSMEPRIHFEPHQQLRGCLLVVATSTWAAVVGTLLIVILAGLGANVSVTP
jgi:hypothetical protein